jgi:hypothetical protein
VPHDPVRDEAERLVAAALAAVNLATRGMGRGSSRPTIATGDPECCVCPVCRAIAAMRDPNNDLADRLASGAGDLATAVTSLLRTLSRPANRRTDSERSTKEGDEFWESLRQRARAEGEAAHHAASHDDHDVPEEPDEVWRAATAHATPMTPPKPMAKKAVAKKAVAKKAAPPVAEPPAAPAPAAPAPAAPAPAAKKAVKKAAKKAAKKAQPRPSGPEESA